MFLVIVVIKDQIKAPFQVISRVHLIVFFYLNFVFFYFKELVAQYMLTLLPVPWEEKQEVMHYQIETKCKVLLLHLFWRDIF